MPEPELEFTPAELQAMLQRLDLDPDLRHKVELLLEATLAYLRAQQADVKQPLTP